MGEAFHGEHKTDAKDAVAIAQTLRMRTDLHGQGFRQGQGLQRTRGGPLVHAVRAAEVVTSGDASHQKQLAFTERIPSLHASTVAHSEVIRKSAIRQLKISRAQSS